MENRPSGNKIREALFEALSSADPAKLAVLKLEMDRYSEVFGETWAGVKRQPFARKMIEVLEEATEMWDGYSSPNEKEG